jgi:hypothetical protein
LNYTQSKRAETQHEITVQTKVLLRSKEKKTLLAKTCPEHFGVTPSPKVSKVFGLKFHAATREVEHSQCS